MKIRLRLILSACIVNSVWAAVQSPSQTKNEATITKAMNDGTEIRQSFQNLFDSIAHNEARRSRQYREVLREEIGRGQKAFSTLDKEILNARSLNADKKRYVHENADALENVIAKKRETATTKFKQLFNYAYLNPVEENFIEYFGNDPKNMKRWEAVKDWFLEEGEPKLKKFCAAVHQRTFNTTNTVVGRVLLESKLLQFKNEEYFKRLVDVVLYRVKLNVTIEDPLDFYLHPSLGEPYMITEGPQPDCVFYLHFDYTNELAIKELVCGIDLTEVN